MIDILRLLTARLLSTRFAQDRGASLVEYALLVALIAIVCFTAIGFAGSSTAGKLTTSGSSITAAGAN